MGALIAVDLDGTLLRDDHTPAPEGARALAEAARRGVCVVIATTRNAYSARTFARSMGLTCPIVCSNGAQVWGTPEGPLWVERPVPGEIAQALTALADARGWSLITTVGQVTYYRRRERRDAHHAVVATNAAALAHGPALRILNYEAEAMPALRALLEREFAGRYHLETYYYPDSTVKSIGVYATGCDKGTALAHVMARLDVPRQAVMVIGDNPNDLPMFPLAGLRVAMGNATADVQAQADSIAPTNEDEGVAWAVRRFVLAGAPSHR